VESAIRAAGLSTQYGGVDALKDLDMDVDWTSNTILVTADFAAAAVGAVALHHRDLAVE